MADSPLDDPVLLRQQIAELKRENAILRAWWNADPPPAAISMWQSGSRIDRYMSNLRALDRLATVLPPGVSP